MRLRSFAEGVSGTIKRGVADTGDSNCWACGYCDSKMTIYTIGMFSALCGAAVFLLLVSVQLNIFKEHNNDFELFVLTVPTLPG
jgi:hypothetical protein